MFRSIRWRLIASYVGLTLLAVTLVGVLAMSLIRQHIQRQETDFLNSNAEAIARQVRPLVQAGIRNSSLDELARAASILGNVRVKLFDRHRNLLADSGSPSGVTEFVVVPPPNAPGQEALGQEAMQAAILALSQHSVSIREAPLRDRFPVLHWWPPDTRFTVIQSTDVVWGTRLAFGIDLDPAVSVEVQAQTSEPTQRSDAVVTVPIGSETSLMGYVELSDGLNSAEEALSAAGQAFLLAGIGAVAIAAVVGLLVGRGLTRPLLGLTAATSRMSGGDLSTRAPEAGQDEIGQLSMQFNQMAARLETSFAELAAERDALRRFIADASHELRTPITALRTFNDLLQDAAAGDPSARAEFLAESRGQIDRLEWITRNLLDLSRLDAGLIALNISDHGAGDLIQAAAAPFKARAEENAIAIAVELPATPVLVRCDRERMEMALSNLLDNALKFTPAGGCVEIGAETSGQTIRLWVNDDGPGIDPADQPHIFDRFYQGQSGEDSCARQSGSGLGLAIVKSIVRAHGGRVSVDSAPGAGSRFTIELPV